MNTPTNNKEPKYARVIIKGDGLHFAITLRHFRAAQIIQAIASIPEKERLHHRPARLNNSSKGESHARS